MARTPPRPKMKEKSTSIKVNASATKPAHKQSGATPLSVASGKKKARHISSEEEDDSSATEAPSRKKRKATVPADGRDKWRPGQYEAYCDLYAQGKQKKKTMKEIEETFSELCSQKEWPTFTAAAIRSKRRRMGDAQEKASLTEAQRQRGKDLIEQNGKSWVRAVADFNEEFGLELSKGALTQSCLRAEPARAPDIHYVDVQGASKRAGWSAYEIELLKTYTNHRGRQVEDYHDFTRKLLARDPTWPPRSYGAFYSMFSNVKRAVVES